MSAVLIQKIILAVVLAADFIIAVYALIRNPNSIINRAFFVFVAGITIFGAGLMLLFTTHLFVFDKVVFFGGYTTIFGLLLLAEVFPGERSIKKFFWIKFIPLLALVAVTPFNVFIKNIVVNSGGGIEPINGPGFPVLALFVGAYVVYSIFLFIKRYLHLSGGLERLQMQYLFSGAGIFAVALFFFNIFLPAVGVFQFNLVGPIASIAFVGMTAYAIIRHRLFNIRLIVTRAVSFILLIVLSAVVYAVALLVVLQAATEVTVSTPIFITIVFLITFASLSFGPLFKIVDRLTRNIFFRGQYESSVLLSRLTKVISSSVELDIVTVRVLEVLVREMHVEKAAFLVIENHAIVSVKGVGYGGNEYSLPNLEKLLHPPYSVDSILIYEELSEDDPVKDLFNKLGIAIAIPILVENIELALLILGRKLSGEIYYKREINLLETFARGAGVAIQNAESYSEIKRLNKGLEKLVEDRTKQLEKAQERELAKEREVTRLRDEFVFIAVHELRAPVAATMGFLQLIGDIDKGVPPKIKDYLGSINVASDHLKQLVDDILEIARSEASSTKIDIQPVDIVPVIEKILGELSPLAEERKVSMKFEKQDTSPMVLSNARKLGEVFANLVSNGIKYNKIGGNLTIRVVLNENDMVVEVEDTGFGIQKDEQKKIFNKFFRSESSEVRSINGTGLGLFITRMLVEKMDGEITFESIERKGTKFMVSLPLVKN